MKIQGEPLVSILIPNKDHIDDLENVFLPFMRNQHGKIMRYW